MARTSKSLGVTAEVRKKWLQRHDEGGESPQEIADKDGYDVRTVRIHIQQARQEREMRESRIMVMREAAQAHYQDLCRFAQQLDSTVTSGKSTSNLEQNPLYVALRQHLKTSPLVKRLDAWNAAQQALEKANGDLRRELTDELTRDERLTAAFSGGRQENTGMVDLLAYRASLESEGGFHFDVDEWFKTEPGGEDGRVNVMLGAYHMGSVPPPQLDLVKQALAAFTPKIPQLATYGALQQCHKPLKQLKPIIHDDLTTIALRRIVPGRCKYCPI